MKAYKALRPDLTSKRRSFQFEIGKKYSVEGEIIPCRNGFHACKNVRDVFRYYLWDARIFEVELDGVIVRRPYKLVAEHCTLIREITDEVKNTKGMDLSAAKRNGESIKFMKNPSEKVQLAAVNQNEDAIMYIENPSEAVQLAVVSLDSNLIRYIKNPTEEVKALAKNSLTNPEKSVE
jgi:hypothetical protein